MSPEYFILRYDSALYICTISKHEPLDKYAIRPALEMEFGHEINCNRLHQSQPPAVSILPETGDKQSLPFSLMQLLAESPMLGKAPCLSAAWLNMTRPLIRNKNLYSFGLQH
ncbi:hypothetical protein KIL84_021422 [Mauremys mutica]|uniref:Uncharacterized protein n=1 Tax=Mauremys mutica TaxID=74926 RepID=A0A9D3X8M9_9SAUR|nr:hypothetical protein KIL84_021422 [Mauremys mutica]